LYYKPCRGMRSNGVSVNTKVLLEKNFSILSEPLFILPNLNLLNKHHNKPFT
jgi:hypothetical protein